MWSLENLRDFSSSLGASVSALGQEMIEEVKAVEGRDKDQQMQTARKIEEQEEHIKLLQAQLSELLSSSSSHASQAASAEAAIQQERQEKLKAQHEIHEIMYALEPFMSMYSPSSSPSDAPFSLRVRVCLDESERRVELATRQLEEANKLVAELKEKAQPADTNERLEKYERLVKSMQNKLKAQATQMAQDAEELAVMKREKQEQIEAAEERARVAAQEQEQPSAELLEARAAISSLQSQFASGREEFERRLAMMKGEIEQHENNKIQEQNKEEGQMQQIQSLEAQIRILTTKLADVHEQHEQRIIHATNEANKKGHELAERMAKEKGIEKARADEAQHELADVKAELGRAVSECERLSERLRESDRQAGQIMNELQNALAECDKLRQQAKQLADEKESHAANDLSSMVHSLESQLSSSIRSREADAQAADERLAAAQHAISEAQEKLRQANERIDFLNGLNQKMTSRVEEANKEIIKLNGEKESLFAQHQASAHRQQEDARKLAEVTENLDRLRLYSKELGDNAHQGSEHERALEREVAQLGQQRQAAEAARQQAESALTSMQAVTEQMQAEAEAESAKLRDELKKARDSLLAQQRAAAEGEQWRGQIEGMKSMYEEAKTRADEIQNQLDKANQALEARAAAPASSSPSPSSSSSSSSAASTDTLGLIDRRLVVSMLVTFLERKQQEEVLSVMTNILQFTPEERARVQRAREFGLGGQLKRLAQLMNPFDQPAARPPPAAELANQTMVDLWTDFLMKESQLSQGDELIFKKAPQTPIAPTPSKYPHFSSGELANGPITWNTQEIQQQTVLPTQPAAVAAAGPTATETAKP